MKLSVFIFCIALCVASSSFAQQNVGNGFIITNSGDTLRGTVKLPTRQKNPDRISFSENGTGQFTDYEALSIREFRFEEDSYVSAIVETEKDQKSPNDTYGKSNWVKTADTVFLETIVRGSKSVFQLVTANGDRFFYVDNNGHYDLLTYRKTIVTQPNGLLAISELKVYQGQLTAYLSDCPSVQSKIKGTSYEKRSMELLFKQYYKCTGVKQNYTKNVQKEKVEFGAVAGVSLNSIDFDSKESFNKNISNAKFASSVNPAFAVYLNLAGGGKVNRISFYNELMYRSISTTGEGQEEYTTNSYNYYHYVFNVSHVKINSMARFSFPVSKAKLFFNIGISARFQVGLTNQRTTTKTYMGSPVTPPPPEEALPGGTRKGGVNGMAGVGGAFGRYSLEARFEPDFKLPYVTAISSTSTNIYFLLGYRF